MTGMGVSRLVVSKILNHIETGVTRVYDRHGYDTEKREALNAWGTHLNESCLEKSRRCPNLDFSRKTGSRLLDDKKCEDEVARLVGVRQIFPFATGIKAGAGGFEPPHDGIRTRCLTAWLRPRAAGVLGLAAFQRSECGDFLSTGHCHTARRNYLSIESVAYGTEIRIFRHNLFPSAVPTKILIRNLAGF